MTIYPGSTYSSIFTDFYFALGEKIANLLGAIQFMPSCIMFAMLCPPVNT